MSIVDARRAKKIRRNGLLNLSVFSKIIIFIFISEVLRYNKVERGRL